MGVVTESEYAELEKEKHIKTTTEGADMPLEVVNEVQKKKYFLFYPDNPKDSYYDGVYKIEKDGNIIEYKIENGVICVKDIETKKYLESKGFQFMYEKEE